MRRGGGICEQKVSQYKEDYYSSNRIFFLNNSNEIVLIETQIQIGNSLSED